jgi:hypothetical protein
MGLLKILITVMAKHQMWLFYCNQLANLIRLDLQIESTMKPLYGHFAKRPYCMDPNSLAPGSNLTHSHSTVVVGNSLLTISTRLAKRRRGKRGSMRLALQRIPAAEPKIKVLKVGPSFIARSPYRSEHTVEALTDLVSPCPR